MLMSLFDHGGFGDRAGGNGIERRDGGGDHGDRGGFERNDDASASSADDFKDYHMQRNRASFIHSKLLSRNVLLGHHDDGTFDNDRLPVVGIPVVGAMAKNKQEVFAAVSLFNHIHI